MPGAIGPFTGGALLVGRRLLTDLGAWQAATTPDGLLRVEVTNHDPDAFEWQREPDASRLRAELRVGSGVWTGPARLESREPLIFTVVVE